MVRRSGGLPSSKSESTTKSRSRSSPVRTRVREYLTDSQGRGWNPQSPSTPEGRLSKFNDEDWFVPTKDEAGHPSHVPSFDVHPAVVEEIMAHVESGNFPLRSMRHFWLVAGIELLRVLHKLHPLKNSHISIIDAALSLNKHAEITASYERVFSEGRNRVEKLVGIGAENEARKLAQQLIVIAKRIPAVELRDRYAGDMEHDFRELLGSGGKSLSARRMK